MTCRKPVGKTSVILCLIEESAQQKINSNWNLQFNKQDHDTFKTAFHVFGSPSFLGYTPRKQEDGGGTGEKLHDWSVHVFSPAGMTRNDHAHAQALLLPPREEANALH